MAELSWAEPVAIAALSSLDNLSFGAALALKGVIVGIIPNCVIASINSAGMLATMLAGAWIVRILPRSLGSPDRAGNLLAGCVYLCIGTWEGFRLLNVRFRKRTKEQLPSSSRAESKTSSKETFRGEDENIKPPHLLLWTDRDGRPPRMADIEMQRRELNSIDESCSPSNSNEHDCRDNTEDGNTEAIPPREVLENSSEFDAEDEPEKSSSSKSPKAHKTNYNRNQNFILSRRLSNLGFFRTPGVVRNFVLLAWCCNYDVVEWSQRKRRRYPPSSKNDRENISIPPPLSADTSSSETKEKEHIDADEQTYREILFKEAFFMGLALTFSNIAAGLAAGAAGLDEKITIIATFIASFLFMAVGQRIGRSLRHGATTYCACSHNDIAFVAALFFLGYGTYILISA